MASSVFDRFLARIADSDLRAVARHWHEARRDKLMPAWGDIDPAKIKRQRPLIWCYRYDPASDNFTGRLAGEEIVRIFGKSFRGVPMRELFPPERFDEISRRHRTIVLGPSLFLGTRFVFRHLDREGTGERICMPLAEDGVHGDGILGATRYVIPTAASTEFGREEDEFFSLV